MATKRRNVAKAIVQHDFNPVESMEVAVSRHEMVKIIQERNGWICVEKSNGQIGYIPVSFCKIIKRTLRNNVNTEDTRAPIDDTKEADISNDSSNFEDNIDDSLNMDDINKTIEQAKEYKIQRLKNEYREHLPRSTSRSTESRSRSVKRSNEHARRSKSLTSIGTSDNQIITRHSSASDLTKTALSTDDLNNDSTSNCSNKDLSIELSSCFSPTEIVQNAVFQLSPRTSGVKTVREVFPNAFSGKVPQNTDVPAPSNDTLPGKLLLCPKEQCTKETRRSTVDSEVNCVCDCHVLRKVKSIVGNDLDFIKDKIKNNLNLLENVNEDDLDRIHDSCHGNEKTLSSHHDDAKTQCKTCGSNDDNIHDPYSVDKKLLIGNNTSESLEDDNSGYYRNHISSNDSGYSEVMDSDTYSQLSDSNIGNDSLDNCSDQQIYETPTSQGGCYGDVNGCHGEHRDNSDISDVSSEFDVANGPEYFIDDVCTDDYANAYSSESPNSYGGSQNPYNSESSYSYNRNVGQIRNTNNGPTSILTKPNKGGLMSHRGQEPQTGFYLKMDKNSGIVPATCNIKYGYKYDHDSTSYLGSGNDNQYDLRLPRRNKIKKRVHFEIDCNEYVI